MQEREGKYVIHMKTLSYWYSKLNRLVFWDTSN